MIDLKIDTEGGKAIASYRISEEEVETVGEKTTSQPSLSFSSSNLHQENQQATQSRRVGRSCSSGSDGRECTGQSNSKGSNPQEDRGPSQVSTVEEVAPGQAPVR